MIRNKEEKKSEHYHHIDYSKPLLLIPMCFDYHINIHRGDQNSL